MGLPTEPGNKIADLLRTIAFKREGDPDGYLNLLQSSKQNRANIENQGRKEYFRLRRRWAYFLMVALVASGIFQALFVRFVGDGTWKFEHHEVFVNTVGAELFLQIAAMCLIVVRCLFPAERDKPSSEKVRSKFKKKSEVSGSDE